MLASSSYVQGFKSELAGKVEAGLNTLNCSRLHSRGQSVKWCDSAG
jgi:hypothetical protein